jgi:selenocysteine-specific elongation factor
LPVCPAREGPATLHIDRVFSVRGAGTVVTGTLWRGTIVIGERLTLLPQGGSFRVRGVQVHDQAVAAAPAGQRVAVNLAGAERREVRRGDALVGDTTEVRPTYRVEAELTEGRTPEERERVQVHHGTRDVPARVRRLASGHWQLRLEQPLLAADGDRLVLRRIGPPDTLGGGIIRNAHAGARPAVKASSGSSVPERQSVMRAVRPPLPAGALELEERLRAAGHQALRQAELGEQARHLPALCEAGRAVRIGRSMYAHPDAIESVSALVRRILEQEETLTLARLRDELGSSRKYAQALLEHLDAARVTRRLADDRRVLRRRQG